MTNENVSNPDGSAPLCDQHRVTLWFGNRALATYRADEDAARRYAESIGRRFSGLRVTVDQDVSEACPQMPAQRLWT
ncbi:BTB/POZ domain-containing protein [Microlunatus parietis]|uniref:Uncharacterized protein n=2 Tax=Microlunatus parietis TaxID=682979 RepID=A0A7Y9LBI1_9ACTN|nr:hypothetical protein [Microlunatus parietis]